MAKWSLDLIGVPLEYRTRSPYALTAIERVDAFPKLADADWLSVWLKDTDFGADESMVAEHAWQRVIERFVNAVASKGGTAFVQRADARNVNEHVDAFLHIRRKRIRNWIDLNFGLQNVRVAKTRHRYVRHAHSFTILAQLELLPDPGSPPLQIGADLQKRFRFFPVRVPGVDGHRVWHRWLEYGVARVGWSARGGLRGTLWYEIRCPYLPLVTLLDARNISDKEFTEFVDRHLWLRIIHDLRFWSSSNPKIWTF